MPRQKKKTAIHKKHLILCEGMDAFNFLICYLNSDALKYDPFFANEIEVLDFGGNEELPDFLAVLKGLDGFSDVISLLIIRDAESSAANAVQQIKGALERNEYAVPKVCGSWQMGKPKTCFLLFPSFGTDEKPGTIEDIGMSILAEDIAETMLKEIDDFMRHLEQNVGREFPHRFKSQLYTYFSVTDKYVTLKLGEAAKAGAFDWTHQNLAPLKNCLTRMSEALPSS